MVWRVRLQGRWLWVYLVLEFQSEPDSWMALRLLVYVGLLAQDLVRRGELVDGESDLLPGLSGLADIADRLRVLPDVAVIDLNERDIVRHPLVASMLTVL